MGLNHKALFTWFMLLMFVILLILRLDDKAVWNWFIIFIPMWFYDAVVISYIFFFMIIHCRNGWDRNEFSMKRKIWYLLTILLKIIFQVLLCLRLEYFGQSLMLPYVLTPLWLWIVLVFSDVSHRIKVIFCKAR